MFVYGNGLMNRLYKNKFFFFIEKCSTSDHFKLRIHKLEPTDEMNNGTTVCVRTCIEYTTVAAKREKKFIRRSKLAVVLRRKHTVPLHVRPCIPP